MSEKPKILAFAGSTREGSYNKKMVRIAAEGARAAGVDVTVIDLRDFPLPLFDEDVEAQAGVHPNARKLKDIFTEHHGLLISSPEYNSQISGVLKNAIDWVSRPEPGKSRLYAFEEKVAAVMSASRGPLGGVRGLFTLRSLLGSISVTLLPGQVTVPLADDAFNEDGSLKDPGKQESALALGKELAVFLQKLYS